jgi:hypothetical protein
VGREELDDRMPSMLLKVGDGWLKMTELGQSGGIARVILPLDGGGQATSADWHYYINDARFPTTRSSGWSRCGNRVP